MQTYIHDQKKTQNLILKKIIIQQVKVSVAVLPND